MSSLLDVRGFWDKQKYSLVDVAEASGHAGGVWPLCNGSSPFTFTSVSVMAQCVNVVVSHGNKQWMCLLELLEKYAQKCLHAMGSYW